MLPDPLDSALPTIVRSACFVVTRCPPDPRLVECHHTIALAYDRAPTRALTIGGHHLSPATGAHKNPSTTRKS